MRLSEKPLLSEAVIAARIQELAAEIAAAYDGRAPLLLAVLKGSAFFAVDLMRRLSMDTTLDFVRAKSYDGTGSTGEVRFSLLPEESLHHRHVLILEDIIDTGRTTAALVERLRAEGPASLKIAALLDKPARRAVPIRPDFVGFTIDDHFVVGYGLDFNEQFRNLPAVYTLHL